VNDGERTPKQAAQPRWVVRLVSFGAAALLAALALIGVALTRYSIAWRDTPMPAVIVSEVAQPPPQPQPRPETPAPRAEERPAPQLAAAETPAPPAASASPPVITHPVWIERPRNPARFYPREAFMQGVEGEVVLDCMVDVTGRLDCSVASETPSNRGFGAAALAIAAAHVMQPATQDGAPVRARYRMIVPFSTSG
jgi:TonB family protein